MNTFITSAQQAYSYNLEFVLYNLSELSDMQGVIQKGPKAHWQSGDIF